MISDKGEHDRKKNDGEQNIGVHSIHSHEGFDIKKGLKDDIALIRLNKPVVLDSRVGTVCLPTKDSRVSAGKKCFITGMSSCFYQSALYFTAHHLNLSHS